MLTLSIIKFVMSATIIVIAGFYLTKCADSISELSKLNRLLVGGLFLAGATSLPELFVDLSAVRKNMPNLAVGDLLGSSLFNLLILAIADILHKGTGKIFTRTSGAHALSAAMSINVTALTGMAIFLGPYLSHFSFGEIGISPLVIVGAYLLGLRMILFEQSEIVEKRDRGPIPEKFKHKRALASAIAGYFVSALIILIMAPFLAEGAGNIADLTGLGKTFIGSTLVALCTSLPEMVSTITAVRMGAFDLAIGNIFGSNSFNMILLLPLDLVYVGDIFNSISRIHILTAFAVILATSVAVMGQLYQVERRKKFIDPDAFAIIGIVIGSLALLYGFREI